jgi:hypothetical protein
MVPLFSFREQWRIQQKSFTTGSIPGIIEFLKFILGRDNFEIVMGDYSCSKAEDIDPSILSRAGKRMQKRTRRRRGFSKLAIKLIIIFYSTGK